MQHQETIQQISDIASKAQYGGSLVAGIFYFINQYAAAIGVVIAIAGFCVNWYYRHKQDKRDEQRLKNDNP